MLTHINESIRELEGRARLVEISRDLWIGQGWVVSFDIGRTTLGFEQLLQSSRLIGTDAPHGKSPTSAGRSPHKGEEWKKIDRVLVQ